MLKKLNSIFAKLLIVILITGICLNLVLGGLFHHFFKRMSGNPIHKNVVQYVQYIIADLGDPPQLSRAKEIAAASLLDIRYEGPQTSWTTSPEIPSIDQAPLRVWHEKDNVMIGRYRGRHVVAVKTHRGLFIFNLTIGIHEDDQKRVFVLTLLVTLTAILFAAYIIIRWIFTPMKWLTEGVNQIAEGNLEHRVPMKRSDELGNLAQAFNNMTERIQKMLHAKERLMLDVSHELRSPLTRMKVALEFISDEKIKTKLKEDVGIMEGMIADILETARFRDGYARLNLKKQDMAALINRIIAEFDGSEPGVRRTELSEDLTAVLDPELSKTVIDNIINNAIKYSADSSDPVEISLEREAPYVKVVVKDNGIGISEQEMPYIFEPFYRVDKSRSQQIKGYGLGLNLCRMIMAAHKGKIEVHSREGAGTMVTLFFPEAGPA